MDALVARLATLSSLVRCRLGRRSERGATASEYALLAALIAGAVVLGVTAFGDGVLALFQDSTTEITNIPA